MTEQEKAAAAYKAAAPQRDPRSVKDAQRAAAASAGNSAAAKGRAR
ncbi:hypothetical protein GCM10010387_16080 [Streptomyces inusitatus]|uniref:Uncharacterized protein n=1 Tax=Streptomyces inusitatus TaxID=68221 RepID=A0A918PWT3_9ACTN|nr:hypothetical protein [Streptomyces inusitatus]GGZ23667.1 hypothetical protein GCM10010387_16080 [Streptomyces inusitatus]